MSQYPSKSPFTNSGMPPRRQQFQFDFARSYSYIFENPKWLTNVMFCVLCMLVPVVGPIAFLGYQMEIVQCLHVTQGKRYPDFDTNILGNYLGRGFWVFVVMLVLSLITTPIFILVAVFIAVGSGGLEAAGGGAVLLLVLPLVFLVTSAVSVLLALVALPMSLRAGLGMDFGSAFDFGFIKQFVGNVWKQHLLAMVLMIPVSMIAMVVGLLAFCVGIYVTMVIVQLMYTHHLWQSYELHLSKGGQPIRYRRES